MDGNPDLPKRQNSTRMKYKLLIKVLILCSFLGISNCINAQTKKDKASKTINTEVDPNYVYEFEKTRYVPPGDKTLLIVGQSLKNINEYRAFTNYTDYPAGWSAYWAVTEFAGFEAPWTTISGDTQHHGFLVEKFDNMVIHSAMWMVGKWGVAKKTIEGGYDDVIKKYCNWAKTVDRPIYLRLGYEFDGPHNQLEPSEYVLAYRRIVDMMRAEGVDNVAYVWHSYAAPPYKGYDVSDWYPGDDYVDWVAISVFFQPYDDLSTHKETNDVLAFAKAKKKPVMIAETNPVKGIDPKGMKIWNTWFVNFFSFCYQKNIKAIAFINENWQRLSIDGIEEWQDARIYTNKKVGSAWLEEVSKDKYLKRSSELYEQLGYVKEDQ